MFVSGLIKSSIILTIVLLIGSCITWPTSNSGYQYVSPIEETIHSDSEAKELLLNWGVSSGNWIENAQRIIVSNGQIKPEGGLSIDLPILGFVSQYNIRLLGRTHGAVTSSGVIVIETDWLYLSAVFYERKYLIVGDSLKQIVNWMLDE